MATVRDSYCSDGERTEKGKEQVNRIAWTMSWVAQQNQEVARTNPNSR